MITNLGPEYASITLNEILERTDSKGFLLSNNTISNLYTQKGWNKSISQSIKDACKDPYKIDWVLGTSKDHIPEKKLDLDKLHDDMVSLYFEDVQEKWLQFISSVKVEPFGDMDESGRSLLKLAREQSELVKFFTKVAELTQINEEADKVPEVPDGVNEAASKVISRKVSRVAKVRVKINPKSLLHKKKEQEKISVFFESLRSFAKSEKGTLGGLEGYRDKILSLSEKITGLESHEGDNVITLFNGKQSDPLLKAWKFTNNELDGMPEHISMSIRRILLSPLEYTGKAISYVLVKQINELWHSDIYSVFSSNYAGKFPFLTKDNEALFDDVMNFFRPSTGIFWGFYDRRLSTFIAKNKNGWKSRKIGSIEIGFNPKVYETLSRAEKIRVTFFQGDGTLRIQKVNMSSTRLSKNRALLKIGEKEFEITPDGGDGAQFFWPNEVGSNDVSLKIFAVNSVAEEFAFKGQWGILRLFDSSRFNILSPNSFIAKWHINVQNVYTIMFVCRVNVSGAEHPFVGSIFKNFDCPSKIAMVVD
jgi:type VI secretion system protein ImpL